MSQCRALQACDAGLEQLCQQFGLVWCETDLRCPCGQSIVGTDEDDLVEKTKQHLADQHPDHEYSRDEILFIAY
jgi:hypothetical protein